MTAIPRAVFTGEQLYIDLEGYYTPIPNETINIC
jgi:hypothetical protein